MSAERLELVTKIGATKTVTVTSKDPAEVAQLSVYYTVLLCSVPKCSVYYSAVMHRTAPFLLSHIPVYLKVLTEKTELRSTVLIPSKRSVRGSIGHCYVLH